MAPDVSGEWKERIDRGGSRGQSSTGLLIQLGVIEALDNLRNGLHRAIPIASCGSAGGSLIAAMPSSNRG